VHDVELELSDGGAGSVERHQLWKPETIGTCIAGLGRKPWQRRHRQTKRRRFVGDAPTRAMSQDMNPMACVLQRLRKNERGRRAAPETVGDIGKANGIGAAHLAS
jgi:hypothetical protein